MPESCCSGSSPRRRKQPCCAPAAAAEAPPEKKLVLPAPQPWMQGHVDTPAGPVARAATRLAFADVFGSWKARWSIGRMDYAVEPGLYCVGNPTADSPVLVTANYKMTFDRLRRELPGVDAWILVLDTKGINVWCAAGKGTFGTEELVQRIVETGLASVVSHRRLILPQLGAVGVAAHEVAKRTGFHVVYGPVRASDIRAFLAAGMQATEAMRTVRFTAWDRLVLSPLEIVGALKPTLVLFGVLFLLNAIGFGHYGIVDLYAWLGAIFMGCVLAPVLLPWIPGRAFSWKGFLLGLLWAAAVNLLNGFPAMPDYGWLKAASYMLILPAFSAYCTLNFTGSSTFTSMSGVDREMKTALPLMLISTGIGIVLLLVNDFILLFS